jgi:hypothetical protein
MNMDRINMSHGSARNETDKDSDMMNRINSRVLSTEYRVLRFFAAD